MRIGDILKPAATPKNGSPLPSTGATASAAQQSRVIPGGHFEAIVIGSGYGGAVAAKRLGQAGVPTLLLEEGRHWNAPGPDGKVHCGMRSPDGRAMWFKDRTEVPLKAFLGIDIYNRDIPRAPGVLDRMNFDNMSVYVGRGVGGTSLVNGGMAVRPRADEFREAFPGVDADAMFSKYFPRAEANLKVGTIPDDLLEKDPAYRYSRAARKSAEKAGMETRVIPSVYDYGYMRKEARGEAPKSAMGDELMYGNNAGKNSVDKTYLKEALETGKVDLRPMHRVERIEKDGSGGYRVWAREIGEAGPTGTVHAFTCGNLFLGAGAMGTPEMLVRARETGTLPRLNGEVGEGWGSNGNVMAARANPLWDPVGSKQCAVPAVAIDNWKHPTHPALAEVAALPMGFEHWISMYLALAKTPERGRIEYDAAADRGVLRWEKGQNAHAEAGARALLDPINKANGTIYRYDLFGGGRPVAGDFTYHPLGGAVLGKATDDFGRVRGYENERLYVVDASLIPGGLGANPFLTVTALAERNMDEILAKDIRPEGPKP